MRMDKEQQGVSIYLAFMIVIVAVVIAAGASKVFIANVTIQRDIVSSVASFYAADTGIEEVLVDREDPTLVTPFSGSLSSGATYDVDSLPGDKSPGGPAGDCTEADTFYCIKSLGKFHGTRRAIEIRY
jgi:hypothetical protein